MLKVRGRDEANDEPALAQIVAATGIFMTGGSQSRLVALLNSTEVMEISRARSAEGDVVAGTSAGASIPASHMRLGGTELAEKSSHVAACKNVVDLVAGFGLLNDIIVDQHFRKRGRLLTVLATNPGLPCVGVDEDTAVLTDQAGMIGGAGLRHGYAHQRPLFHL